jgi:hypothetical protein
MLNSEKSNKMRVILGSFPTQKSESINLHVETGLALMAMKQDTVLFSFSQTKRKESGPFMGKEVFVRLN